MQQRSRKRYRKYLIYVREASATSENLCNDTNNIETASDGNSQNERSAFKIIIKFQSLVFLFFFLLF